MKKKALVVAGIATRAAVVRILQPAGYAVELTSDLQRMRELLATDQFDVGIASPSSLGADGQSMVRELQEVIGRVVLLANGATEAGRFRGSYPGVSVLSQSLDKTLLLDRISELLKPNQSPDTGTPELLSFEGRTVDLAGRTFTGVDGNEVQLTRAEFQLLATFLAKPRRVLSRDQLREDIAGRGNESFDRSVDMLVARLRRKIEPDPRSPRFVVTVPGEGYRFTQRPHRVETEDMPTPVLKVPSGSHVTTYFERRQMTVLACQLAGLGTPATNHDPEDVLAVTTRIIQAAEELIKPLGGKLIQAPGESFLIYFGYPEAHEDDAELAVRSALGLVRSLSSAEIGSRVGLNLRVGVATGTMLVGGMDAKGIYTAVGEPVNVALHLRSLTPDNGVLVATSTRELLGRFFDCEAMAPVTIDGRSVEVWRVQNETTAVVGRFDGLRRADMLDIVDRAEQTELLTRRWLQAKSGTGQVVLITGEPGIGKSRLLAEIEHQHFSEAHICLKYFGRPNQTDASMYAVISELQHFCQFERGDPESAKTAKLRTGLLAAGIEDFPSVELLCDLLAFPSGVPSVTGELSPLERKKKTFGVLHRRIKGLAHRRPVLIIVEDIHWIDPASLEFIGELIERAATLPVLVLIASRPGFSPPWLGHAHVTMSELPRLARSDAELLLARVADGKDLPKDITRRILEPTDGVPLFIEELTKTVLEIGLLHEGKQQYEFDRGDIHAIPRTLHGSLLARLDRLGSGKEVAQIGAVIGREFSYELLSAVAAMPEAALRAALDRLATSELIYQRGTPPLATYIFKHALVRDAAYGMLLRSRRSELHGAIARTLENRFSEIAEAQPELLAHHYAEADNAVKAVHYLSVAGERALTRSALDEAYMHITRALDLITRLPDEDGRRCDELKLRIALARTLLEQKGYADVKVAEAYTTAAQLSKLVADPGLTLAVHYGLWAHHYIGGKPTSMLVQADEFLNLAKQDEQSGPIITGYRLVGTAQLINGHIEKAGTALDEALSQYTPVEHGPNSRSGRVLRSSFGQDVAVTIYSYLSWARWLSGSPDRAAVAAAKAEQSGRESGHMHSLFYALWHAGMANVFLRNQSEVSRLGSELTRHANERELPYWQALGHFLQGWYAKQSGQADEAVARLRLGLDLWEQRGSRVFRPICMAFLADAYSANGQTEFANATFETALKISRETGERWAEPEILRLQAELLAGENKHSPKVVTRLLENAMELAREQGSKSLELRAAMSLSRISSRKGKSNPIIKRLSDIYLTFDEGLNSADLVDAQALLTTATR